MDMKSVLTKAIKENGKRFINGVNIISNAIIGIRNPKKSIILSDRRVFGLLYFNIVSQFGHFIF